MNTMDTQLNEARVEAVDEISCAIIKAVSLAIVRHGDDPMLSAIVSAALGLTIDRIDRNVSPGFRLKMIALLSSSKC